jgi:hypothetical protein
MRSSGSIIAGLGLTLMSIVLLGLFLLLSGCSVAPIAGQQAVPDEFLAECRALEREIRTNGDLAKALQDHKLALANCNLDKRAIRQWSEGLTR